MWRECIQAHKDWEARESNRNALRGLMGDAAIARDDDEAEKRATNITFHHLSALQIRNAR